MATTHVVTCPKCGHTGPVAQFNKRHEMLKGATTMLSTVQKIALETFDDHDAPSTIAKAASEGIIKRSELQEVLMQRATDRVRDGETVAIAYQKCFADPAPRDPVGAQLFQILRKMETAFAGRRDDDPVGKRMLAQMLAA